MQYGFEVATAAVRTIPYVGWFAGLIMDGYFFVEGLVASGVFNFTDWLRGNGGFAENLVDFGYDVGLAFIWLGLDALNTSIRCRLLLLPAAPAGTRSVPGFDDARRPHGDARTDHAVV